MDKTRSPRRRRSRQRELVYDTVASTETHPTAEWVYARVRRTLPRVSLGTVYRNLQLLVAQGRLKSLTRGRTTRFDADVGAHDHFVCEGCGLLLDIPPSAERLASEHRLRSAGHVVTSRTLEFHGLCKDCRRTKSKEVTEPCPS
jgi:Fe2+ or Zn2+ uptake regulation protein